MTPYILYDTATGKISQSGTDPNPAAYVDVGRSFLVTEQEVDPDMFRVDVSGPEPVLMPIAPQIIDGIAFDNARRVALANIENLVLGARTRFITNLPGQDAIYQAKYEEAVRFQADPLPNMSEYPFLTAEVGVTAPTAADLAAMWVQLRNGWLSIAAHIEKARLIAGASLQSATTIAAIDAAITTLSASLTAIVAAAA